MLTGRFLRFAAGGILLLAHMACLEFSPPVREEVTLRFLPGGGVEVSVATFLADPRTSFQDHPKAMDRLERAQWEALNGKDAWAGRFSEGAWERETFAWEKAGGNLVEVRRGGRTSDPEAVATLFGDLPVSYHFERRGDLCEMALFPLGAPGGTELERRSLEAFLEAWLPSVQRYLELEGELYAYLEAHPDRAAVLLAEVYEDCLPEPERVGEAELLEEEKALMDRLGEALGKVVDVLEEPKEEAFSPDELSRRLVDPIPAPLEVVLPSPPLEVEGFERAGETGVRYGGTGLWSRFGPVTTKWASPDLVTRLVPCLLRKDLARGPSHHLADLVAEPRRRVAAPSLDELRRAFDEALRPAAVYRVKWRDAPVQPANRQRNSQ